jgi:hypothetical protein
MSGVTHVISVSEWLKLPEVSMPSLRDNTETGTIVIVAKVGFLLATEADCRQLNLPAEPGPNGKLLLPTAMIQNGDRASLHRLPTDLTSWVVDAVALARIGKNLFPSRVEFGRLDGRPYAEYDLTDES